MIRALARAGFVLGSAGARIAPIALALLALAACGESAEERLERVTRELAGVRAAHARAEQLRAEREQIFERAKQELEAARGAEREAALALAEAEKRVDLRGLDDLIFRLVQERLLADQDLERAAIRASVERGVVTLEGSAASAALRDRAIGLAQTTAGVSRVKDSIRVVAE